MCVERKKRKRTSNGRVWPSIRVRVRVVMHFILWHFIRAYFLAFCPLSFCHCIFYGILSGYQSQRIPDKMPGDKMPEDKMPEDKMTDNPNHYPRPQPNRS